MITDTMSTRAPPDLDRLARTSLASEPPPGALAGERARRFRARLHPDLDSLAAVWRRFEATGSATAYQRLDWLTSLARHLAGTRDRLLVVEVSSAACGEPMMLVPMAWRRRWGVRIASWADFGVCDYAAPVLAPGVVLSSDDAVEAWRAVLSVLPAVDLIDVKQIPAQVGGVPNPLALLPCCRETRLQAFGLDLGGDPETQARRLLGAKNQRDLDRRFARLSQHGPVSLIEPSTASEVDALFGQMVEQRRRRFRQMGRHEILDTPAVEAFYRDMALRSLTDDGPVRLFGLAVGEEIVATTYMLVHGGSMYGILLAIGANQWTAFSPGLLIAVKMIEWAANHRLTYFDMTVGSLSYKARLGGRPRALSRILEPRTALGRLAAAAIRSREAGEAWLAARPELQRRLRDVRHRARRLTNRQASRGAP